MAERDKDLLIRYKKALEYLTPGGSEFVDDPERCARHVRERLDSQHRAIVRLAAEKNAARAAAIEECAQWISVDERLPSEGQMVLVYGICWNIETYPCRVAQAYADDPKKWFDCPEVTHWMPLPEPPRSLSREKEEAKA